MQLLMFLPWVIIVVELRLPVLALVLTCNLRHQLPLLKMPLVLQRHGLMLLTLLVPVS